MSVEVRKLEGHGLSALHPDLHVAGAGAVHDQAERLVPALRPTFCLRVRRRKQAMSGEGGSVGAHPQLDR